MAIISIPTSIGGVTIPGSALNGPLGALYSNAFQTDTLQYPRDLQSMTRGHVVHFTVREVSPINFESIKSFGSTLGSFVKNTFNSAVNAAETASTLSFAENLTNLGQTATNLYDTILSTNIDFSSTGLNFQPKREKIVGNIFLYMPETVNFQYASQYNDTSVLEMAQKFVGALSTGKSRIDEKTLAGRALSTINTAAKAAGAVGEAVLQKAGYAINPQLQLLFQGIGFREYQMVFTFTPYSKQETEQIRKIIKMFRQNAAPRIVTEAAGMFFIPPASFTLDFLFNGQTNPYISKVAESVITSVDVNYAPNGYSTHDDGSPVQIQMTLQFKEIQLIDKTKIQQGY